MTRTILAIIRTRHFKRPFKEACDAMIIVTVVTLVLMMIAQMAYADANQDGARGKTLEDWQAMICGPDAADVWSVDHLERNPHTGSGTLQPAGLWAGGWLDVPDHPPLLQNLHTHPGRALQASVTDPDPTPPQVSLPPALWLLAGAVGVLAMMKRRRK